MQASWATASEWITDVKRSKKTALVLMGAAPLLFTACQRDEPVQQVQEGLYTSVESCGQATGDAASCRVAFDQAQQQAADSAPQYASRADCEQDYSAEQCTEQRTSTGQSFIGPMMAGFFLSRMLGGVGGAGAGLAQQQQAAPAWRNKGDSWLRPSGAPGAAAGAGRAGLAPVSMTPDRAVTVNRGGFGASGGNRSSVGG
jgi:uncharacterized protein YgiB involved in biofilm formation